jgi:hypothetical protein
MTNDIKLVTATSLLPVFADFLEDLNEDKVFRRQAKIKAQNLIAQIRSFDEFIMNDASVEAGEQQVNIQIAFRQWLSTAEN